MLNATSLNFFSASEALVYLDDGVVVTKRISHSAWRLSLHGFVYHWRNRAVLWLFVSDFKIPAQFGGCACMADRTA